MHVVVRDEYNRRKDAEKRTALVFELHRISGKSEGMIRKMLKK
jgi:hypothetical protein